MQFFAFRGLKVNEDFKKLFLLVSGNKYLFEKYVTTKYANFNNLSIQNRDLQCGKILCHRAFLLEVVFS